MDTLQEWQQELSKNKTLQHHLSNFISQFGISNIEHALQLYTNLLCRNSMYTISITYRFRGTIYLFIHSPASIRNMEL